MTKKTVLMYDWSLARAKTILEQLGPNYEGQIFGPRSGQELLNAINPAQPDQKPIIITAYVPNEDATITSDQVILAASHKKLPVVMYMKESVRSNATYAIDEQNLPVGVYKFKTFNSEEFSKYVKAAEEGKVYGKKSGRKAKIHPGQVTEDKANTDIDLH